jgi:hypothetical protein
MLDERHFLRSRHAHPALRLVLSVLILLVAGACEPQAQEMADDVTGEAPPEMLFSRPGTVADDKLDEISGMQASRTYPGLIWVHNDSGKERVHAIDELGTDLGHFDIKDAKNKDWEDITLIPREGADLLVVADIGDNDAKRDTVRLFFVEEPAPDADGKVSGNLTLFHKIKIEYPDGPRDCEAMAWDPLGERLLFLTKRNVPPQLYELPLETALQAERAVLTPLGIIDNFRPPTAFDVQVFGKRSRWASQPTGMDISPDGRRAVVISYRSLYLFDLPDGADWAAGLRSRHGEIYGPPMLTEESVTYSADGKSIYVIPEGKHPPVYRYDFP